MEIEIVISSIRSINSRYWSNHHADRFYLVVDLYKNGPGKCPETYFYNSMEG